MQRGILAGALSGLALCGVLPGVASAQVFEGVVRYTIHDENGKTIDIVQMTKHGKMRQQFTQEGRQMDMIIDSTAGTMTMVDAQNKTYTVITREMMQQVEQGMQGLARMMPHHAPADSTHTPARPKGTITRTGRSETVAGISCDVYAYDGGEDGKRQQGELCLAKGVGAAFTGGGFGTMGMSRSSTTQDRLRAMGPVGDLLAQGYGLLKVTRRVNGQQVTAIEVTGIDRRPLGDDQFHPPAGFQEKSMGDMMHGGNDNH